MTTKHTSVGTLVNELFEAYQKVLGDDELAAVVTEVTLNELLMRQRRVHQPIVERAVAVA